MPREVTEILDDLSNGLEVKDELFERVYEELRSMAQRQMHSERQNHTLQSTALVNEAFVRLAGEIKQSWKNRRHFFATAAECMRRVLIESARSRKSLKRGGNLAKHELVDFQSPVTGNSDIDQLLDLERHLDELQSESAELAEMVKLRFFAGMSMQEIADCLETSLSSVERRWRFVRAWLAERLIQ